MTDGYITFIENFTQLNDNLKNLVTSALLLSQTSKRPLDVPFSLTNALIMHPRRWWPSLNFNNSFPEFPTPQTLVHHAPCYQLHPSLSDTTNLNLLSQTSTLNLKEPPNQNVTHHSHWELLFLLLLHSKSSHTQIRTSKQCMHSQLTQNSHFSSDSPAQNFTLDQLLLRYIVDQFSQLLSLRTVLRFKPPNLQLLRSWIFTQPNAQKCSLASTLYTAVTSGKARTTCNFFFFFFFVGPQSTLGNTSTHSDVLDSHVRKPHLLRNSRYRKSDDRKSWGCRLAPSN